MRKMLLSNSYSTLFFFFVLDAMYMFSYLLIWYLFIRTNDKRKC